MDLVCDLYHDPFFSLHGKPHIFGPGCRRRTEQWKQMTSELASSQWVMTWYGVLYV